MKILVVSQLFFHVLVHSTKDLDLLKLGQNSRSLVGPEEDTNISRTLVDSVKSIGILQDSVNRYDVGNAVGGSSLSEAASRANRRYDTHQPDYDYHRYPISQPIFHYPTKASVVDWSPIFLILAPMCLVLGAAAAFALASVVNRDNDRTTIVTGPATGPQQQQQQQQNSALLSALAAGGGSANANSNSIADANDFISLLSPQYGYQPLIPFGYPFVVVNYTATLNTGRQFLTDIMECFVTNH